MLDGSKYTLLWCFFVTFLPFSGCRSKTSPGCPAGMIWDGKSSRQPVGFPHCGSGEHADTIVTYILQAEACTVTALDSYEGYKGDFIELQIPKLALPGTVPYLTNAVSHGTLYQDVLNATQFMDEWVEMSFGVPPGLFANPMRAAANQCFEKYKMRVSKTATPLQMP